MMEMLFGALKVRSKPAPAPDAGGLRSSAPVAGLRPLSRCSWRIDGPEGRGAGTAKLCKSVLRVVDGLLGSGPEGATGVCGRSAGVAVLLACRWRLVRSRCRRCWRAGVWRPLMAHVHAVAVAQ